MKKPTLIHELGVATSMRLNTYNFAIEIVLANHDSVDRLGVYKVKEGKATGTASSVVSHDGAVPNFAELREIAAERICW